MKIVVVAGQSRKIGKTSVMAGLIRGLRSWGWTAVKISTHRGGVPHADGAVHHGKAAEPRFILAEEERASAAGDTGRFLRAGAKRALWLRARTDSLGEAVPELVRALGKADFVMIESNSILSHVAPAVSLLVCGRSKRGFKNSSRKLLSRVDAIVCVAPRAATLSEETGERSGVRTFKVTPPGYSSAELCRFIRKRVGLRHAIDPAWRERIP
jgi:molybdopterin-guanine dinucleotide biosynthesis protein